MSGGRAILLLVDATGHNGEADVTRWAALPEGQFFERKSAWDRSAERPRRRKAADIAWDIVETLSAMANADGGELVVGIEDRGEVTGVPLPEDKLALVLRAAGDRNYVDPPLRFQARRVVATGDLLVLCFSVDWSPDVHRLADSRTLLRVGDANHPFPSEKIAALKALKVQGLLERSFPPGAALEDIDLDIVTHVAARVAPGSSSEQYLLSRRLVDSRHDRLIPTLAGLLLFGKDPLRWHPRCYVDIARFEGTARRTGAAFNLVKRVRVEAPIALLIQKAFEAVAPQIRERQRLQDLFFTEKLEYPTFAWQEALVNAVGHRDYSIQGAPIEVWMYDDHMEVRSPGPPPVPITLDDLKQRRRIHLARNPLMVRVLSELGFMRDQGEGIPRMYDVMEAEGFYPPSLDVVGNLVFQVTLRNEPVYDDATLDWLRGFAGADLTGDQKRLLAFAHAHGDRFTSRDFQKLADLDLYAASNSIKELIRKGVVRSLGKGSRVYEIVVRPFREPVPAEIAALLPLFDARDSLSNSEIRAAWGVARLSAWRRLREFEDQGWLVSVGEGRWTRYRLGTRALSQSRASVKRRETET